MKNDRKAYGSDSKDRALLMVTAGPIGNPISK
jgi:hypothetical protein